MDVASKRIRGRSPTHMPRILIVDPNRESSATTEQLLSSAGYDAASMGSFEDASRSMATSPPDVLVTAVRLGRFNGLHLALRARAEHPSLPVVVLGEDGDSGLAAEAGRLGARFVAKSHVGRELVDLVSRLLDDSRRPSKT